MRAFKENFADVLIANKDRYEGYGEASRQTTDIGIQLVFTEMSMTAKTFYEVLFPISEKHCVNTHSHTTGKLYRVWMDIKTALVHKDQKAILFAAEFAEDCMLNYYNNTIKSEDVPSDVREQLISQRDTLARQHLKLKSMRENLQNTSK